MSTYVLFEGPDGCGKTEIAKAVAHELNATYFKVDSEKTNWGKDTFHKSLWFDRVAPQLLRAIGRSVVFDRSYISEWAYPQAFKRTTDDALLSDTDKEWSKLEAIVVILLRRDYAGNREDDLVPASKLRELHDIYAGLPNWTSCKTITMYVDDFRNSLELQIPPLVSTIEWMSSSPMTNAVKDVVLERG